MSIKINWEILRRFSGDIFRKFGLSEIDAFTVADTLVFANLRGIDSHGVVRIPPYLKRLEQGGAKSTANIRILKENPASVLLDGNGAMGQVIGAHASQLAVSKAESSGVAFVVARGSAHYGAASYYAVEIAKRNMIGISSTNTTPSVAAWGGARKALGNDPLSIAVPYREGFPLVLDISMSKTAGGKLKLAVKNNQSVPTGLGLDKSGRATTDPKAILDGGVHLPFGEHKGYGLAVMLEIINAVLSGANMLGEVGSWTKHPENPSNLGQIFAAINIAAFLDPKEFAERLDAFTQELKQSPPAEGGAGVLLPGEIEARVERERRDHGIPVPTAVWNELMEVSKTMNVTLEAQPA